MNLLRRILSPILARRPAEAAGGSLMRIIQPQARDRWMSGNVSQYTPETIEMTIRGAMSGNLLAQWQLFDLMEGTWYRLQKNLQELKRSVVGLDWSIHAWAEEGGKPSEDAQFRRKLLGHAVWSMRPKPASDQNEFEDTLWHLLDAWAKGIVVLEVDWEQRTNVFQGRSQAAIMPVCTRWIHPNYYGYPMDRDELMIRASETGVNRAALMGSDYAPFPEDKFLIGICKQKAGHPIGSALLRCLGFWWAVSNFTGEWMLNFAQLFGQPLRWATYDPANPDVRTVLEAMMENMGSAAWAVIPAGTQLELKESIKSGTDNPQTFLLNFADTVCDILVLGQTLTSDVGESGSLALGEVHQSVRADIIDAAGNWAAKVLNYQFIPAFCRLNFGDSEQCPYFVPSRKQARDATAMAARDQILAGMGMPLPLAWLQERHDVPPPQEGEALLEPKPAVPGVPVGFPPMQARQARLIQAKAAEEAIPDLVRQAVADAAGVRVRWLAPLAEELNRLIATVQDGKLDGSELAKFLDESARNLPDLFGKLNINALADSLEDALGAAALSGLRDSLK